MLMSIAWIIAKMKKKKKIKVRVRVNKINFLFFIFCNKKKIETDFAVGGVEQKNGRINQECNL